MNGAAASRTALHEARLHTVADVCSFVDGIEMELVGELVITCGGVTRGVVFVQHGRVCWAAARGLARRLTELLVARAGGDARAMEGYYSQCRSEGARWGEWLVAHDVLSAHDLRSALLEHTVESLGVLCQHADTSVWCPRAAGGYSPQFTFGTAELLSHAGASAHPDEAQSIAQLHAWFMDDDWGAAFVVPTRAPAQPIALWGAHPMRATALQRAGQWAASALDVAMTLGHDEPVLLQETAPARALVAFRHRGLVVVGETGAFGPARILNRRAQLRLPRE